MVRLRVAGGAGAKTEGYPVSRLHERQPGWRSLRRSCQARTNPGAGIHLHAAIAGDGPPVILLHGFPETWWSWRRQIPALARAGFSAWALDMRGYGVSLLDGLERVAPRVRIARLPRASHWVQNDEPDEVNAMLVRFLSESSS